MIDAAAAVPTAVSTVRATWLTWPERPWNTPCKSSGSAARGVMALPDPRPYAARVPDVDPPIGDSETIRATSMISGTSTSGVTT